MRRRRHGITAAILATLLLSLTGGPLLAAGSQAKGAPDEETEAPVTITALIGCTGQMPSQDNAVKDEIAKRTGIDFQPVTTPFGDYQMKLNARIASGELPDIITVERVNIEEYVENRIIVPLDDLLASHGQEVLNNKGHLLKGGAVVIGGKVYVIPTGSAWPVVLSIRQDWLKNTGHEVPGDLESYYEVLKSFTKDDPNQDGKDNTIGLGVMIASTKTMQHIFGAFGVAFERPHYVDGEVVPYMLHPKFLDAIKYWRRLYAEGLMEPDFATIPVMPCFEKLWNGIYGAFDFQPEGTTNNWLGRYTEDPPPEFTFALIRGPEGKGGWIRQIYDTGGGTAIASRCKHPDKAMELLNFFNTEEGSQLTYFGIEGVHYRWTGPNSVEYIPPYDDSATHRNAGGFVYGGVNPRWHGAQWQILNDKTREGKRLSEENELEDAFIYELPEIEKEVGSLFDDLMKEAVVSLIVSEGDIEQEYEEYKQKYLDSGGRTWIEQATEIYLREQSN